MGDEEVTVDVFTLGTSVMSLTLSVLLKLVYFDHNFPDGNNLGEVFVFGLYGIK